METIWSLITSCLHAFTSKTRQCRLGYDTSPQCDSFQLGEFTKFLVRAGYLVFTSSLGEPGINDQCEKGIVEILSTLKSCPSYQVDQNHSHCGPRKRLVAGLEFIESCLREDETGLCLDCWNNPRHGARSWADSKSTLAFDVVRAAKERAVHGTPNPHHVHIPGGSEFSACEFFTAEERLWTPDDIADHSPSARTDGTLSLQITKRMKHHH